MRLVSTAPPKEGKQFIVQEWAKGAGRPNIFFLAASWLLLTIFFRFYLKLRVEGKENVPRKGPLILVSNHLSTLDAFIMGLACGRRISYLAKAESFRPPLVAWMLRQWGCVPLKRGEADTTAVRESLRILRRGDILGIFPEGTRSRTGDMQQIKLGVAKLALKTRLPMLPAAVSGTYQSMPKGSKFPKPGKAVAKLGKPFELTQFYGQEPTGDVLAAAAEIIRNKILELSRDISP